MTGPAGGGVGHSRSRRQDGRGKAAIKRFIDDRANGQVVLLADSFYDYEPIFLHEDDDFSISGKVVAVIKNPA